MVFFCWKHPTFWMEAFSVRFEGCGQQMLKKADSVYGLKIYKWS